MKADPDVASGLPAATSVDRAAALAQSPARVPRKVVVIAFVAVAVLTLGGTALERVLSSVGLNPTPSVPAASSGSRTTSPPALGSSMAAFLGIVKLPPAAAPALALTDQNGVPVDLAGLRGRVVVVTFFDADCADACSVLAADIKEADADLGAGATRVAFLTVDTDPLRTKTDPLAPAVASTGLGALANWHFLGGSLSALDAIWRNYGVQVNVSAAAGIAAHNNVMYFLDPQGRLRVRATPVADESPGGTFSLPPSSVRRSGEGIASNAVALLSSP